MEQNQFRCSGDCLKCHPNQRQYCASQFTYNSMRMIEDVQRSLSVMQGTIDEMRVKIDAIQGNEASLFDPTNNGMSENPTTHQQPSENPTLPIAQSGDGAESRSPETN